MKRTFTIFLIISALSIFTLGQSIAEKAVMKAENDIIAAFIKGDAKALAPLLADDVVLTADNWMGTKQSLLKDLQPEEATPKMSDTKVSVYGDAAVVTGIMEWKGKSRTSYTRFTDTFVRRKTGWQLVASQMMEVPVWRARRLGESELKIVTPAACSTESTLRSQNADVKTYIRFVNSSGRTVYLYWINYDGERDESLEQTASIKPGEWVDRTTYLTHPFVITDKAAKCLGIYQPTREPGIVVIK